MSYEDRYNSWCKRSYVIRKNNENKKKILLVLLALLAVDEDDDDDDNKKKYLSIISKKCSEYSFYYKIFPKICLNNSLFRNYFHMNPCKFEELLCIIVPSIITQNKYDDCDKKISIVERLALTLRFLTSGDSKVSMSMFNLKHLLVFHLSTCDRNKDVYKQQDNLMSLELMK
ncbi:uncharacterized protein LOC122860237 [Aphidius gifuensis]|uniref:uncharacterized protein LOC122860237 n=1 Tax=Aphidius gifuensis TaxID=684658 RepID=UPI001CDC1659|nr:uncharacterized protein LOC122860237 [Aphidius gifuensis]